MIEDCMGEGAEGGFRGVDEPKSGLTRGDILIENKVDVDERQGDGA